MSEYLEYKSHILPNNGNGLGTASKNTKQKCLSGVKDVLVAIKVVAEAIRSA